MKGCFCSCLQEFLNWFCSLKQMKPATWGNLNNFALLFCVPDAEGQCLAWYATVQREVGVERELRHPAAQRRHADAFSLSLHQRFKALLLISLINRGRWYRQLFMAVLYCFIAPICKLQQMTHNSCSSDILTYRHTQSNK